MSRKSDIHRPPLHTVTSAAELKRWYWLKKELMAHAGSLGISTAGGKFTILERLAHFLETGDKSRPGDRKVRAVSDFDWQSGSLSPDTVITDSYKSSQNVRRFFQQHADPKFKFTIAFMDWMKANVGKSLADAIEEYHRQQSEIARPGFKTKIADHNQFNQYTRDFLADNPEKGMADVRRIWALKRALPSDSGRHVYEPSDLDLES